MTTILVVDKDPVFAAVVEDRLHVAGYEVEVLHDRGRAVTAATAEARDLLILELAAPFEEALQDVRTLRGRTASKSLPILALSESVVAAERVAALRAGADDYLTKPCDLEELVLRAERLLGDRQAQGSALQGDLATHPMWELMQYLQQAGKSGELTLRGTGVAGQVDLVDGQVMYVHWEDLPPVEALLAVFGLKQGRFHFNSEKETGQAKGTPVSVHEVLLEAAWLEDELEKRRAHLPVSGAPLEATGKLVPQVDEELAVLPVAEVLRQVKENPGVRLYDLLGRLPLAPQKVRLAVAWLVEEDCLRRPEESPAAFPNTLELASLQITELAIEELLGAARGVGFGTTALPLLVLAEPGNWPGLLTMLEQVPGFSRFPSLTALVEKLRSRSSGSASFVSDLGKLTLNVMALETDRAEAIEANVTVAAGVLLWLADGAETDLVRRVVKRLDEVSSKARGVVVVPPDATFDPELLAGSRCWRQSAHAPQSLLGVFRLLQPVTPR